MRRLTAGVFQSLDGVMQGPGGPTEDPSGGFSEGGWITGFFDEVTGTAVQELFTPPYALLLGRRTYDIFAAYWPYVRGAEAAMGEALTAADKYVLTHGDQPLEWENSHRLADIDAVAALKESDGPDLLIQGSGTLYPPLLQRGLIDRLIVMTFPVLIGSGKRTFAAGTPVGALRLAGHKVSGTGAIVATYTADGAIERNPFESVDSERERARQSAIAEGSW